MQDLNDKTTGSTLTAAEWNEVPSELQNVIEGAGITLSGGDLTQLGQAISSYISNGTFFVASGTGNAVVLTRIGSKQASPAHVNGERVAFLVTANNTGATTINRDGIANDPCKDSAGNALTTGAFVIGNLVECYWNDGASEYRQIDLLTASNQKTLKSGRKNFFANGQMRVSEEFGVAATVVTTTAAVYTLDQIFARGITTSQVTHTQLLTAGVDSNQSACEVIDAGVNTGAVMIGFACGLFTDSNEKAMVASFEADISANDNVDYEIVYADDSALTNSTAIASGTIAMTTGEKTYEIVMPATTPAGTNQGIFVMLKKNSGAGNRTYTITAVQVESGSIATYIESTGDDGGLAACRWFFKKLENVGYNYPIVGAGDGSTGVDTLYAIEPMRATPTCSYQSTVTASAWRYDATSVGATNPTFIGSNTNNSFWLVQQNASVVQYNVYSWVFNSTPIMFLDSRL